MTMLVLDNSIAMSWCFRDQRDDYSESVLRTLVDGCAVVPELWLLEVANVTALAEQRGVLSSAERKRFLGLLGSLRTQVDHASSDLIWGDVYDLAVKHRLTSYDARYLELSQRMGLPLASSDKDLLAAAKKEGVARFAAKR